MAIPDKGARTIVVDGQSFRWRIKHKPTYGQAFYPNVPLRVAISPTEFPGSVLIVSFPQPHPGSYFCQSPQPVLPSDVAQCIQQAMAEGWDFSKSRYLLTYSFSL